MILDDLFPEVDLSLRQGRHVGREDDAAYTFLIDGLDHLEPFYRRYGAELVHKSDGYFYLLPIGDRLGRSQLTAGEMLVGQALALLYLDPSTLQLGGVVERELLLQRLSGLVGTDELVRTLNPRRRKFDERVAAETVRTKVGAALRELAALGFVDLLDADHFRLRPALMRFAEPVRSLTDPTGALERLIVQGEVKLSEEAAGDEDDGSDGGDE
ncbi:MAG TPA: chromosome partition protein MukE [Myxococcota bacterium]|nr:chromosome partition protein MukE [Myxococcota bacterium]